MRWLSIRSGYTKGLSVSIVVKIALGCFLFFLLVMSPLDTPARAQEQHVHDWQAIGAPIEGPYIWLTIGENPVEYLRCGQVARLNVASILDWDECIGSGICEFGNWVWDDVYLKSWSDGDAGGKFGYLDGSGNFVESSTQISHYKASDNNPRTVHITLTVDDMAIWGPNSDDAETTNSADVGNLTVWEFTISDSCGDTWRPQFNTDLTYTADIDPTYDHRGNLMAGTIEFQLTSSQEPGYCLNATQMDDIWHFHYWYHTGSADIDLKFFPANQQPWPDMNVWNSSGFWGHEDNYDRAATTEQVNIAQAKLRCFDYGAFGSINAVAYGLTFSTEEPIGARLAGTSPEDYIFWDSIPTDKEPAGGNSVADVWDNSHGLGAKPGGWDEENNPQTGDNAAHDNFKGDGYTYYEEYRGLEVDGAWTTMEHDWKEVFIYDEDNLGIGNYPASGLIPYVSRTATEMTGDNVVNMFRDVWNHPELHLAEPQHGLRLVDVSQESGYDDLYGVAEGGPNGPPGNKTRICINKALILNDWGTQSKVNHTIAHELGHGSNLWHHGDNGGWWDDHVTGVPVAPQPVPLPPTPYPNHYRDADPPAGTGMPFDADTYDGDACNMQYLRPIGGTNPKHLLHDGWCRGSRDSQYQPRAVLVAH